MSRYALTIIVAALSVILLTSDCLSKSVTTRGSEDRTKREVSSWDVISPYFVQQQCYARPCRGDGDCCPGYACTGLRAINRRAVPLRSCALSMQELENLL